jgi:hypothetical protein
VPKGSKRRTNRVVVATMVASLLVGFATALNAPRALAAGSTAGTGSTYCQSKGATNAGANFLNVYACNDLSPHASSYWQCVELAERFIQAALGFPVWHADTGALFVAAGAWNIPGQSTWPPAPAHPLPVGHPGPGLLPNPGDIISYQPLTTGGAGHVAVVVGVSVTNQALGNATIKVMEENWNLDGTDRGDSSGYNTISVSGWNWSEFNWTSNSEFSWLRLRLSTDLAFQGVNGSLYTRSPSGTLTNWGLGMMARTSPSIAALPNGGTEEAFQDNTGSLWTVGANGNSDWHLGMMAGTSPSIASLPNGSTEVAFQANTGHLWVVGGYISVDTTQGMMAGTSPSITALPGGGIQVAFQASNGILITIGYGPGSYWTGTGQGVMAGTSPSIAALPAGGVQIAFQANNGVLITVGYGPGSQWLNTGLGMTAGTSPSIAAVGPGVQIAVQADNQTAIQGWVSDGWTGSMFVPGIMPNTSPTIAS